MRLMGIIVSQDFKREVHEKNCTRFRANDRFEKLEELDKKIRELMIAFGFISESDKKEINYSHQKDKNKDRFLKKTDDKHFNFIQ